LNAWSQGRRKNAAYFDGQFKNSKVQTPVIAEENVSIYNQYVIRVKARDDLIKTLRQAEIGCEIYYPVPLHLQKCFSYLGHKKGAFPIAEAAAQETLAIPIFPELTEEQKVFVASTVCSAN